MLQGLVTVGAHDLGDHHLVAAEPFAVALLGLNVFGVGDQLFEAVLAAPVIDIGDAAGLGVFPGFLAQVTLGLLGGSGDQGVQAVELVVKLLGVENKVCTKYFWV